MILKPSYQRGFAKYRGESQYPSLWNNLDGLWIPGLGTVGDLIDYSGKGNNAEPGSTGGGALPTWNPTKLGYYATSFDGQTNKPWYNCGQAGNYERTDKFSIFILVRLNTSVPHNFISPISKMDGSGNYRGWAMHFDDDGGNIYMHFFFRHDSSPANWIRVDTDNSYNSTTDYYSVLLTYDGSSNASGVRIYVDGVPQALSIIADNLSATTITTTDMAISSRAFANLYWDGDNVISAIWNRELTQNEGQLLYRNPLALVEKAVPITVPPIAAAPEPEPEPEAETTPGNRFRINRRMGMGRR